jgi:hypothetical protein
MLREWAFFSLAILIQNGSFISSSCFFVSEVPGRAADPQVSGNLASMERCNSDDFSGRFL